MPTEPITTKLIPLCEIRIDGGTQIRVELNPATVAEYAERMADGDKFPNLHVFCDGTHYWLADGFHRYHALKQNGAEETRCEVHTGMAIDARRFALSANGANGLRMTNADKRKAVAWGFELYPMKSSRELAKICYVSHQFVENCRPQLSTVDSSTRIGADGKTRKMPTKVTLDESSEPTSSLSGGEMPTNEAAKGSSVFSPEATAGTISPALRGIDMGKVELSEKAKRLIEWATITMQDMEGLIECVQGNSCDVDTLGCVLGTLVETRKALAEYQLEIKRK